MRLAMGVAPTQMWVYEEMFKGRKLTEIINEKHENVKYLPGVSIPDNVVANPDLVDAVTGASLLVFVLPHQVSGHAGTVSQVAVLASTALRLWLLCGCLLRSQANRLGRAWLGATDSS